MSQDTFTVNGREFAFPRLIQRYKAMVIDLLVILILIMIGIEVADSLAATSAWVKGFSVLVAFFYIPIMTAHSATIGQRMMGIRVRRNDETMEQISFVKALIRMITKSVLGWLSFITINFNEEHKAIHDMAAGSVVIDFK